ncbi:L-fucose:H+ symporter permease [Olivibacter domesticus]|uniref:MFS transporter, FHS family, L-fucose permease n=1 Tax=Olivibacter domesticus TaxID=407022 RepID=A0A1H7YMS4_OLID1|nr:L-fucose:H+ symporter permease [Olivibacter domesticus]SEM47410.1 MFS transporter, FHS family, L-fucose permease [Olivibacter domesticus]
MDVIIENLEPAEQEYKQGQKKFLLPFILVTGLFFLWGMAHNLDSILIPHLKKACNLSNSQSTLVDTAVFFAYFIMAIPAGMLLKRLGYKYCIIIGLLVFAAGAYLFVPAANKLSYELFLVALFIIGCGLAILETTANPYAAVLGDPATASNRLNLAASFNGLAAMVAPIVGANFILSGKEYSKEALAAMPSVERMSYFIEEASAVKLPYIILGTILLIVALLFCFIKLPEIKIKQEENAEKPGFFAVLKHRHLSLAVLSQFFYVGAQVCITSFFIRMAQQGAGVDERTAGYYLGIYGFLFMLGRFVGTFLLRFTSSQRLLICFTLAAIVLCLVAVFGTGTYVVYALGLLGFFMSIMFPTIFALGIVGLGDQTKSASSWLIMSIVGGAILPYGMGSMIDYFQDNIQIGYLVPLSCFLIVLGYAWKGCHVRY